MAAVTVRTRCEWVKFGDYGELLYVKRFVLELKGAVDKGYLWPAILYRSKAWCLRESETRNKYRDIHGGSNVWSTFHR